MSQTNTQTPAAPQTPKAVPTLSIRTKADNPDHHLWNNHGIWFVHYTIHPGRFDQGARPQVARNPLA